MIVSKPTTIPSPVPNTIHVAPFSALVGPENYEGKKVSGCYVLHSDEIKLTIPRQPGATIECYIGQEPATRLGTRVKIHAKGYDSTTKVLMKTLGDKAMVTLFILESTPDVLRKIGLLHTRQFLCVLEQYLILFYNPSVNKSLVATHGVLLGPEALAKLRTSIAKLCLSIERLH